MPEQAKFWAVVPAAGVGARMGADRPKQYLRVGDYCVIEHTLLALLAASVFEKIVVAVSDDDPYWPNISLRGNPGVIAAAGGLERSDSVLSALRVLSSLAEEDDWVLVHDAARCCVTTDDILRLIAELENDPVGGILAVPVYDTLKRVTDTKIAETVDRRNIWRALTPQMFRYGLLKDTLERATSNRQTVTDEASAIEMIGCHPRIVEGRPDNIKITRPEDLHLARFYLEQQCTV